MIPIVPPPFPRGVQRRRIAGGLLAAGREGKHAGRVAPVRLTISCGVAWLRIGDKGGRNAGGDAAMWRRRTFKYFGDLR